MTMENPATASWDLHIGKADFAKLIRGVSPRDMDDKWWIRFMTDQEVSDEAEAAAAANRAAAAPAAEPTEPEETIMTEEELDADLALEAAARDRPPPTDEELLAEYRLHQGEGGNISIRRSWSPRHELYRLAVGKLGPDEVDGAGARIEAITWEQKQSRHVSEEQAKIDVVLLCRSIVGCELAAAPDHDTILFSGFPRSWTEGRRDVE